jgi:hypothetical protein
MSELRSVQQRKADVLAALNNGPEGWLATAATGGRPHLITVSSWWDGERIVVTTLGTSRTARNLAASGQARLGLGSPEDVIVIDVSVVEHVPVQEADPSLADGFAATVGWDPRQIDASWQFFTLQPRRIQAYRGYDELEGRDVMREGRWLA